eukprot:5092358-Pyramimonas_sp.AAC.1
MRRLCSELTAERSHLGIKVPPTQSLGKMPRPAPSPGERHRSSTRQGCSGHLRQIRPAGDRRASRQPSRRGGHQRTDVRQKDVSCTAAATSRGEKGSRRSWPGSEGNGHGLSGYHQHAARSHLLRMAIGELDCNDAIYV